MNIYTSVEDAAKKQAMGRLHEALNKAKSDPVTGEPTVSEDHTLRSVG
jgi:hypothetical protein